MKIKEDDVVEALGVVFDKLESVCKEAGLSVEVNFSGDHIQEYTYGPRSSKATFYCIEGAELFIEGSMVTLGGTLYAHLPEGLLEWARIEKAKAKGELAESLVHWDSWLRDKAEDKMKELEASDE